MVGVQLIDRLWNEDLRHTVEWLSWTRQYDWVIAEHSYAVPYVSGLPHAKALTAHNIEYRLVEQLVTKGDLDTVRALAGPAGQLFKDDPRELRRLKAFEQATWRAVDACAVVSPVEWQIIASVIGPERTILVPNCPGVRPLAPFDQEALPQLLFVGALNYLPNVDAVLVLLTDILPRVRQRFRTVKLTIAGREPGRELTALCRKLGAIVVDSPAKIEAFLGINSILVCPLRFGAGTRIKILDAIAARTPVVASPLAVEGLGLTSGKELLIGETVAEICRGVEKLLESLPLRISLATAGQRFISSNRLNWPYVFRKFEHWLRKYNRQNLLSKGIAW